VIRQEGGTSDDPTILICHISTLRCHPEKPDLSKLNFGHILVPKVRKMSDRPSLKNHFVLRFAISLFFLISLANVASAQINPEMYKSLGEKMWEFVVKNWIDIWAILSTVAATVLAFLAKKAKLYIAALKLPAPVLADETRNSVLVLGLGGSGKTSLIKSVTNNPDANPKIKSADFKIYDTAVGITNPAGAEFKKMRLFISDYAGQNLTTLFSGFINEQRNLYSQMRYGYLNSLILVVDLFDPPENNDDVIKPKSNWEQGRVKENLNEWNKQVLQAVVGLFTKADFKYICLFINKIDLVNNLTAEKKKEILEEFSSIYDTLEQFGNGLTVERIIGSASDGTGINKLKQSLLEVRGSVIPRAGLVDRLFV
jgi:GTPase SAR1 family protein